MKRTPRKKGNNRISNILIIIVLLLLLVNVVMIWMIRNSDAPAEDQTEPTQGETTAIPTDGSEDVTIAQNTATETTETTEPVLNALELPVELEDGKLTVLSLFQYSGLNPDCGDEYGDDIAGIMIQNTSSSHLSKAELEIATNDGRQLHFALSDIPAGRTAMAFSRENLSIKVDTTCTNISCKAEYEEEDPLMTDLVDITVTETGITVKNISGKDLVDLTVYCHNVLETDYYGGTTCQYVVEELPAGKKCEIDTSDNYFGLLEVARVDAVIE